MASVSIQGRIDSALWESIREDQETNTQLLQRIAAHYVATSGDELKKIAPTPAAAISVLLYARCLLSQIVEGSSLSALQSTTISVEESASEQLEQSAAECAEDW